MTKRAWKKVGHRTLKHMGEFPKMVVRFAPDGRGKAKVTDSNGYPVTDSMIASLVGQAEVEWARIKESEVVR